MAARRHITGILAFLAPLAFTAGCQQPSPNPVDIASLADLSVTALRAREYGSTIEVVHSLSASAAGPAYREAFSAHGETGYTSLVAKYDSDGNRIYTRIDIPAAPPPSAGYPVLIFVHGWYGREQAPEYNFLYDSGSLSARVIDAYADAGFLVLSPALRGHGTVSGSAAEGIEFLDAWDNGSYLGPVFYAIDVLNLLEGLQSLSGLDGTRWGIEHPVHIDLSKISITGHSQGGDAVLTALAVSGEGSTIGNTLAAGSLWSGCFAPRFEQAEVYGPMATTPEAFLSGDGRWTGGAAAADGIVNPNFVFGFPSDWIGTVDVSGPQWTWQAETWSVPTVAEALEKKFSEMYRAVNEQVADISGATFSVEIADNGRAYVKHDPRVEAAMQEIGAYHFETFLTEPIHFHHSDQDYYSLPRWNAGLAERIRRAGGRAADFAYPQNNHSLQVSDHDWFSNGEVVAGFDYMLQRDRRLFGGGELADGPEDQTSVDALRRYAAALSNEFRTEFERPPLDGLPRRVVRFSADGLRQYALLVEPAGEPPQNGWPVVLMNHGYHPNPPDNGRLDDGSTDRPGDYYRGLPLAFARAGFLVVWPDFRGHNVSEGQEYTRKADAHEWYTRDVIAAFRALDSLPGADPANVFLWGHSMGGAITVRALLALGDEVRGASLWSTAARFANGELPLTALQSQLIIHHSSEDPTTPFEWSRSTHEQLSARGHPVTFHVYQSDDHLFGEGDREQAIRRDIDFFRSLME